MEKVDYENRILFIDDKPVDGNQIRSMTDKELKNLIEFIYNSGYDKGWTNGNACGYVEGYDEGRADHSID